MGCPSSDVYAFAARKGAASERCGVRWGWVGWGRVGVLRIPSATARNFGKRGLPASFGFSYVVLALVLTVRDATAENDFFLGSVGLGRGSRRGRAKGPGATTYVIILTAAWLIAHSHTP